MLTAVLTIAYAMAYEARGVIWADAKDLPGATYTVTQPGTYTVWAWTDPGQPATVTVNDTNLSIAKPQADNTGMQVWAVMGTAILNGGAVELAAEGPVATVVLAANPAYDPGDVMKDMRAHNAAVPPADARLAIERETNTTFTMTSFKTVEEWEAFAADLERTIKVACGLLPMPEKTPLNPQVHPVAEHDDYIVEKVYFEPFPGFLASGNLYRPKGEGPFPGVINPHGHWENGRLEDSERGSVPGRCITLARMGMVAFAYDMIGYNDSNQFGHRMEVEDNPLEEKIRLLYGIHPFALQTLTSLRAIDFVQGLPYVDKGNIACTGASGGGTQTFIAAGIDGRIKTAAPVNMISHTMQGGCICENAPLIRFENSNMEIGALAAPRPMLVVSATGDWTSATPDVEFPAIKSVYALYGAADKLANVHIDAGHNFNQASREAVYRFFGKWVLDQGEQYKDFAEPAFEMDPVDALRLTTEGGVPEGYPTGAELAGAMKQAFAAKWNTVLPKSASELEAFQSQYRPALNDIIGAAIPEPKAIIGVTQTLDPFDTYTRERLFLGRDGAGDTVPAILYTPTGVNNGHGVVMTHGEGKGALADIAKGGPGDLAALFLDAGYTVMTLDPFLIGENRGTREETSRVTKAYPDTFLPTDTAYRIQDILTAAAYLRGRVDQVNAVGLGDAGLWTLFAAALDKDIHRVFVDLHTIDLDDDAQWAERFYLPGIRSLGDVVTAGALVAPRKITVATSSASKRFNAMQKTYYAAAPRGTLATMQSTAPPPGMILSSIQ